MKSDVFFTLRSLRQNPGFTATALLTLILGIGATTAIFSVVHAVLFRPLPYLNAKELVHIVADDPEDARAGLPYSLFDSLRERNGTLQAAAIYYRNTGFSRVTIGGQVEPETAQAGFSSASLFRVLGVKPAIGRVFEDHEVNVSAPVAVISSALWNRRFGGRTDVLGQVLEIDEKPFIVVGVMPREFQFPARETQLWLPITTNRYWAERLSRDNAHSRGFFMRWNLVARLRAGIAAPLAQNEMNGLASRMSAQDPAWNMGLPIKILPISIEISGRARLALLLLLGAVMLVLLIACTNVANLLLARGAARTRELAIRSALGASQGRIARQVLTESLILVSAATAGALLLANWAIPFLIQWGPAELPRLNEAKLDASVFGFALVTSLFTAVLFGLWPAIRAGQSDPQNALKSGGRGSIGGDSRAAKVLIVTEFTISVVLATSAGLLLRSLWETARVDLGFRPAQVLTLHVRFSRASSLDQLYNRLKSIPGVERVGGIKNLFELGPAPVNSLRAVDGESGDAARGRPLTWTTVSGEYFQAMGMQLLAGRLFSDHDGAGSELVAIIDESMAKRYWPNRDPIGRRFKGQDRRGKNDDWISVIGVVRNARRQGIEQESTPHVFLWHRQSEPTNDWVIRTSMQPTAFAATTHAVVREIDSHAVIANLMPLEQQIELQTTERKFQTWLLTVFAALAVALAAVGIFGVMSHSVARRTHEIGIRMALGAGKIGVIRMFLMQGIGLAAVGLGFGVVVASGVTRILAGLLYGVKPTDTITFASAGLLLLIVAAIGTIVPAWRAARIDPVVALRRD